MLATVIGTHEPEQVLDTGNQGGLSADYLSREQATIAMERSPPA